MQIVTIDFDIIMAPSIQLYRSLADDDSPEYADYYNNFFHADLDIYSILTTWLHKQFLTIGADNIFFIKEHHQIYDLIPSGTVNLINIDHHHDLGYGLIKNLDDNFMLNCGNWGYYLLKHKMVQNFTWIHNYNSVQCTHNVYSISEENIKNYDFNILTADKIIICLSELWIPKQYLCLFQVWMDIASQCNNITYNLIEIK